MRNGLNWNICFALIFAITLLPACSTAPPNDSQAEEIVNDLFSDLKQLGVTSLSDFTKLNGELFESSGQKEYVYHFLAAAKLPAKIVYYQGPRIGYDKFMKEPDKSWESSLVKITKIPTGATAIRKGTIQFRLTEKGWLIQGNPKIKSESWCSDLGPSDCYSKHGFDKFE